MDEDTDLKSAGLKGFGGSIPFLSAKDFGYYKNRLLGGETL